MELNSKVILEILHYSLGFIISDTILGPAIEMNSFDAFKFANVTGAGYFDNPTYLFSPKGALKVFREAFKYNFVTGIFNKQELFYSPLALYEKRNYLFAGKKYIVCKEFTSEAELSEQLHNDYEKLLSHDENPTDYLILRIEAIKKGNGMEPLLEYLACEYFLKKGYVVENQVPLAHAIGTPDFAGFKLRNTTNGFHIIELAMVRLTGSYSILKQLDVENVIVGEAKTSTKQMATQLKKYMDTGIFNVGFEMHPDKLSPTYCYYGMFNINSDYSICFQDPKTNYDFLGLSTTNSSRYIEWYKNLFKYYIIANCTNQELKAFVESEMPTEIYSQDKIKNCINRVNMNRIVNYVLEVC